MRCLIITKIGYPFGGAEDYLFDTLSYEKFETYWISFTDKKMKNSENFSYEKKLITIGGGYTKDKLKNWVMLVNPDIIHTQGCIVSDVMKLSMKLKINTFIGFHFWNDLLHLNKSTFNKYVLENMDKHRKHDVFENILKNNKYLCPYVCSDFLKDIVKEKYNYEVKVNYPISSGARKCFKGKYDLSKNVYITQINIHKLKGGLIFLHLLKKYPNIPFLCIQTEPMSEELDSEIKGVMDGRENCEYLTHTSDIVDIYRKTRILLIPSLVDETFCRVCVEGMSNGIPVLTTGYGNIKFLLDKNEDYICSDVSDYLGWERKLDKLYNNSVKYSKLIHKMSLKYSEKTTKTSFFRMCNDFCSKKKNLMFLAPFCDQGLGIQVRNYATILKYDYNIFIFSYKPYMETSEKNKDKKEWDIEGITVDYIDNIREEIKDIDIIQFVKKYDITDCIIPETCWFRIFEIAMLLKKLYVRCFAIPNIEIVRQDELFKHRHFYKILCNNRVCYDIFKKYKFNNIEMIGYGMDLKSKLKSRSDIVRFTCIGGLNAFSRKMVHKVCDAFIMVYDECKNIHLTVTIQGNNNKIKIEKYKKYKFITIIEEHLPYKKILELYYNSDINIQVSSHEGLGLGFYESLSTGTPVITIDTSPHNEIIVDNMNGWIVKDCYFTELLDNNSAVVKETHFKVDKLKEKKIDIIKNNKIENIYSKIVKHYKDNYTNNIFKNKIKCII